MRSYKAHLALAALGILGAASSANAVITLSPSTSGVIAGFGYGPSNCEDDTPINCVETVFGTGDTLSLLYKANVEGGEEGPFATSYTTLFYNTTSDPSDALLFYDDLFLQDPVISCDACYLAIKDGRHSPGYYFYDLSGWDGLEAISFQDFWPDGGAISHISIWGDTPSSVPEPATLGLFSLGLLGLGFARRRKNA